MPCGAALPRRRGRVSGPASMKPCAHLERLTRPGVLRRSRTAAACGRHPHRRAARRVARGAVTLRWEPDGAARGEVALLHGVMALAETWWRIGPALAARGWRVAAVDLPGHGGDVHRDGALDLDALVDGVAARLDGPVDLLVGHSLGAIVALGLLARDPGAARAVVLEEPPGPARHRPGRAGGLDRARRRGGAPRPRAARRARARGQPALGPGRRRALGARHRGGRQRRDRRRR